MPMESRFDFCSLPTNLRKKLLRFFKMSLPIVAPVAPTSASKRGSSELSNAKKTKAQTKWEASKLELHLFQLTKEISQNKNTPQ